MSDNNAKTAPARIKLLPPELRDQIAAGEVVERPASVLKELLENSLDAGADEIGVKVENGGQSFLSVRDNGCGIDGEDLQLALTSHATSKIRSFNELLRVSSFGFRGEALPSIASVARVRVSSRRQGADAWFVNSPDFDGRRFREEETASFIEAHFGRVAAGGPSPLPYGTLVEVWDLFSNVPARLKFLKTNATELKRCQEVVVRAALAGSGVTFTLAAGEREICRFMKGESLRQRLEKIWPPQVTAELLPFALERPGIRVSGLAGRPRSAQARGDRLLFYVNGRAVSDRLLQRASREAYKGRLLAREFPQLVMFVEIEPEEVDVNVHPAKTEVRFRDERTVFGAVLRAVESALAGQADQTFAESGILAGQDDSAAPADADERPAGFWGVLDRPATGLSAGNNDEAGNRVFFHDVDIAVKVLDAAGLGAALNPVNRETPADFGVFEDIPSRPPTLAPAGVSVPVGREGMRYIGQVADTYLIALKGEKLLLLDQHAVHERILMHRFSSEAGVGGGGGGQTQFLALPLELRLHQVEAEQLQKLWGELSAIGFSLKTSGASLLLVNGIPALLERGEARDFLRSALAGQGNGLRDLLTMMSCKGAIKAGRKLSNDEALGLLKQWEDTPERDFCPHGRPAVLVLGAEELEKMFKRR